MKPWVKRWCFWLGTLTHSWSREKLETSGHKISLMFLTKKRAAILWRIIATKYSSVWGYLDSGGLANIFDGQKIENGRKGGHNPFLFETGVAGVSRNWRGKLKAETKYPYLHTFPVMLTMIMDHVLGMDKVLVYLNSEPEAVFEMPPHTLHRWTAGSVSSVDNSGCWHADLIQGDQVCWSTYASRVENSGWNEVAQGCGRSCITWFSSLCAYSM